MSATQPRHTCDQLGACQARTPRCARCPEAELPPADARQGSGSFFWPLVMVLMFGTSAALVSFVLGWAWAKYGDAMLRALDAVLRTLGVA